MRDPVYSLARAAFRLPPSRVRTVARRNDLDVPMSDGTVLLADHWVPDGDTAAPLVLVRSPYGRRSAVGLLNGRFLAHQGFQVVVQSCRGTAGSQGRFDRPFAAEADDGRDTVTWLQEQPFYPGSFATFGGSYLGYTQLALPDEQRSEQFAAVLQIAPTSARDVVLPDGMLALHTVLGWSASTSRGTQNPVRGLLEARRDAGAIKQAGKAAPLVDSYVRVTGERLPHLDAWLAHPSPEDPWWHEQDHAHALQSLSCPVLVQAGWWDAFLEASIEQYRRLAERGTPARLSIGPWSHTTFTLKGAATTLAEAAVFLRAAAGLDAPLGDAPIRLQDSSGQVRLELDTWPDAEQDPQVLYLHGRGLATAPVGDGPAASSFTYDPSDPTPSCGGVAVDPSGGPKDNRRLEARPDVLTFDAPVHAHPTTYLGQPVAELWLSADVPHPQVFVRVNVVDGKGRSVNLADRLVQLDASRSGPGGAPSRISIALPPIFRVVRPGERLRLLIAGGAFPIFARSPGSGEPSATAATFLTASITVHHDDEHPSALRLPEIATPPRDTTT